MVPGWWRSPVGFFPQAPKDRHTKMEIWECRLLLLQTVPLLPTSCSSVPTAPLSSQTHRYTNTHWLSSAGLITNQPRTISHRSLNPSPRSTHSAAEPKHTPLPRYINLSLVLRLPCYSLQHEKHLPLPEKASSVLHNVSPTTCRPLRLLPTELLPFTKSIAATSSQPREGQWQVCTSRHWRANKKCSLALSQWT